MNSKTKTRIVLGAGGALLVCAIGFQLLYSLREVPQPKSRERIAKTVPGVLPGWAVQDEPLSATETANEATLKVLNLDDYVYRRFHRGTLSFTVYAAYWAPGRMPTRLVASHTPDRCWTENGMRCVEMRFREIYRVGGKPFLPAEYRVFTDGRDALSVTRESVSVNRDSLSVIRDSEDRGQRTYVAYWHTVEGKLYDYGQRFNAIPHPWLWWKDTLAQAAYGSREQLFVRIASATPLDELWREAGFQSVMAKVADLGLWDSAR